jgi:ABC-type transporter Mla subunit MlaD
MGAVELIEYALRDAEVPMSDMLARALEQIESDLATAEQDSRQKQARIERLESALRDVAQTLAWMQHGECRGFSDGLLTTNEALEKARDALEESK